MKIRHVRLRLAAALLVAVWAASASSALRTVDATGRPPERTDRIDAADGLYVDAEVPAVAGAPEIGQRTVLPASCEAAPETSPLLRLRIGFGNVSPRGPPAVS